MVNSEKITEFAGLPVIDFDPARSLPSQGLTSAAGYAIRLGMDWEAFEDGQTFDDLFAPLLADPLSRDITSLVIGNWGGAGEGEGSEPVVEALVSARERLPRLQALFLGEMTSEESEISWINQSDISPLFDAFPELQTLYVRGGSGLRLGRPRHEKLVKLVVQTGGLDGGVLRELAAAELPALTHLELWFGSENYGNNITADDVKLLCGEGNFPRLKYLGLRDDELADATAESVASLPIIGRIETLDLSLGTLTNAGVQALLASPHLGKLKLLDIHHHFVDDAFVAQLRRAVANVNAEDRREIAETWDGREYRYNAVSE